MIGLAVSILTSVYAAAPSGQIAFLTCTEQEDQRVVVVDVQSGEITHVGAGERDCEPVWSPDGEWIAYVTVAPKGGTGVRIVHPDGTGERLLKRAKDWNYGPPSWSPDGTRLAYSAGSGLDQRVMVYDLDADKEEAWGTDSQSLLRPVWAGDGRIVAVGTVGEMGALTTNLFWVTKNAANAAIETQASVGTYVEWSPQSCLSTDALAYESNDGGDREIFVYLQNRGAVDVSNHRAADWNPVWSPDGQWVAFESFRDGRRGIYRVNPTQVRVTAIAVGADYDNWAPTWSPDSQWIAFISNRDGAPKLYATDVEGEQAIPLSKHDWNDLAPAWRPEPKR